MAVLVTHTVGGVLPATSCSLTIQNDRDTHTWMDGGISQRRYQVPEIAITKADNASVLPLCEISGFASEVFELKQLYSP